MDIKPVLNFALEYNPFLAMRDISTVHMWVNEGCDVEKDILATLKEVTERRHKMPNKDKISTFSYFSSMVRAARDKRLITSIFTEKTKQPTAEEKQLARLRNIKWHKQRGLTNTRVGLQDFAILETYEKQHGEISI